MSMLKNQPSNVVALLQEARMNEDVEVVHYATVMLAELHKDYDLKVHQLKEELAKQPDNLAIERRELGTQLLWSLSSIPKVSGLHLVVDGRPYPLPGQNDKQVLELSSQQDYQPLSKAGSA